MATDSELQACDRRYDLAHWTRVSRIWLATKRFNVHALSLRFINQYKIRNQNKPKKGLGNLHQSKAVCTLQELNKEELAIN